MNCMICGGRVTKDLNKLIQDSGEVKIKFGYGSENDGDEYVGVIHDCCFEEIKKNLKRFDR